MTTHQSATINGLLAENIGKNGLVRDANSRAQDAEMKASQLQREAQFQEIRASRVPALEAQLEYQKKQTEYYKNLLSKPMQEIARVCVVGYKSALSYFLPFFKRKTFLSSDFFDDASQRGAFKLQNIEGDFFLILRKFFSVNSFGQFHQHFTSSFCANIIAPKKYKPKL